MIRNKHLRATQQALWQLAVRRERRPLLALVKRYHTPYCLACDDTGYVVVRGDEKPCPWCHGGCEMEVII